MPAPAQSTTRSRRPSAAARSTKWLRSIISRSSSNKSDENLQHETVTTEFGDTMDDGVEILVPSASDIVYKYTWNIRKFGHSLRKRSNPVFDSEAFELNVNGLRTRWNLSIRFWTGPDGKRLQSPVVACLNLLRCYLDDSQPGPQATVRFQFGVFCRQSGRYEMTPPARSVLALGASRHIVSVGHLDVAVLQRHLDSADGDVRLVCKLQVVPTGNDDERHSLSQDLGVLLEEDEAPCWARGDVMLRAAGGSQVHAHRCILGTRSPRLAALLDHLPVTAAASTSPPVLELDDLTPEVLQELLRYIYTGRIENIDALAPPLIAAATKYELPGLVALCERSLLETLNSESVAARLLLADEFGCETLKRAALAYCSEGHRMPKNVAWTVMEMVNPELFQEACEAGLCEDSSASSFGSSISDTGSNSR